MNMLDMYTREKVNKLHITEMQMEARNRHLLRNSKSASIPGFAGGKGRLVLIALVLIMLVSMLLISAAVSFY